MKTPLRIRDAIAQLRFACELEGWSIEWQGQTRITGQTDDGYVTRELTGEQSVTIRPA